MLNMKINRPSKKQESVERLAFISQFPELKEKDGKYYLYQGLIHGLGAEQVLFLVSNSLEQDIFKRKIFINKILASAPEWTLSQNDRLFSKIYETRDNLSSYFKKESASMMLMALFPFVSVNFQNKLAKNFAQSKYKNNRKRIYKYFYKNWTENCQRVIESAWEKYRDEEAISLIVAKMPKRFLHKNREELLEYFDEEELTHDFFKKILRNKFFARLYDDLTLEIDKLMESDPISYIAIKKDRGEKIDIAWAVEVYKKFPRFRFLARWYSDMGLWGDILKQYPDFITD